MGKARYKFIFNRRVEKLLAGQTAPIHLEVYFSRTDRSFLETNVRVEEKYWDKTAKMVKKTHPNYIALYQLLNNMKNEIEAYELSLINKGKIFTQKMLDAFLNGQSGSFFKFSKDYLEEQLALKKIGKKTRDKYNATLNTLMAAHEKDDILFSEVNENLIKHLDAYLVKEKYEQTTIHKSHTIVKKFIKEAERKGFLDSKSNPYNDYSVAKGKSSRTNLEPGEQAALETLDRSLLTPELEIVLDKFLYSCFTGLRIGDSLRLARQHLVHTDDGIVVDMITEKGGGQRIVHHLRYLFDGKPEKIIQKYLDLYPGQETVFPEMAEPTVNRHLKTLAYLAKIKKVLTFHMARHTCGTALADITANPYLIKEIMGHSDIKTSMIYIHASRERVRKQLMDINWKWS